ncbi:MAG TPA: helix-turn-helix domain-containing protein, partial [Dehalococcoidia bacterium]|nr:helix-turn-helix domain-containing protein [Dehalococcoidia bacterium]
MGEQASTRTLTVSISDSPQQTRLVLHAQADRFNLTMNAPDLAQWRALDRWLELAGERQVIIPFAHALADLVPATAVRMRRDFPQLLAVVQVMALLHQCQRGRDSQGRIVASLDDCAQARWLLEEVFDVTVSEGLTPAVRQTVETVSRLSGSGHPVTEQQLSVELGMSKSAVSYRVKRALQGGWLVNLNNQRGAAAQLLPDAPIPDGSPLPTAGELLVCVEDPQNHSNPSNPSAEPAMGHAQANGSNDGSNRFEPGSNQEQSCPDRGFERFETFSGGNTHTEHQNTGGQGEPALDPDPEAATDAEPDNRWWRE